MRTESSDEISKGKPGAQNIFHCFYLKSLNKITAIQLILKKSMLISRKIINLHKLVSPISWTPHLFTSITTGLLSLLAFLLFSDFILESPPIRSSRKMKLFTFFLAFVGNSVLGQEKPARPENWWKMQKIKQNRLERMQRKQITSTRVITTTTTSTTTTTTTAFVKPKKSSNKKSRRNRKKGKNVDYSTLFDLNTDNLELEDAAVSSPLSPNQNSIFSMSRSQSRGEVNGIHPNTRKIAGMLRKELELVF